MAEVFVGTRRNGKILAYESYEFTVRAKNTQKIRWQCRNRKVCKGAVNTDLNGQNLNVTTEHDPLCLPDAISHVVSRERGNLKRAVQDNVDRTVSALFTEAANNIQAFGDGAAARFPTYKSCQSSLCKTRQGDQPEMPATLHGLVIPEKYRTTKGKENFVFYQNEDNSIVIFGTASCLETLGRQKEWSYDGTFDATPTRGDKSKLWQQLFSIHAFHGNKLLPLFFCMLTSKSQETYVEVLRIIRDKAAQANVILNPTKFRCDFETGLLPALRQEFQGVNIQGCHFHYTQAIWRNVQKLGLTTLYALGGEAYTFIKCLYALPFLPENEVQNTLDELINELPADILNQLEPLIDYFMTQWMTTVPLKDWNVHNEMRRTNNNLEGWHSRLGKLIPKNPNLEIFMKGIWTEHGSMRTTQSQIAMGKDTVKPNPTYKAINDNIARLNGEYMNGTKTALEFVKGVAHNLVKPLQMAL